MADPLAQEERLSESIDASGGLQQFRTVSQRPKGIRDDPFGRPAPVASTTPSAAEAKAQPQTRRVSHRETRAVAKPPTKSEPAREVEIQSNMTEAELFPDRVTVPLSVALSDQSEDLARSLSRNRSVRKTRITRNSVIRVALQCFLENYTHDANHPVNSEDELLAVARSKFRK